MKSPLEISLKLTLASLWLPQVDAPWDEPWQASQVMAMELAVLQALEWRVGGSSSAAFLDRLLHVAGVGRDAAGCLHDPATAHNTRNSAKSFITSALLGMYGCK